MENNNPTWHKEAIVQNIDYVVLVYCKAAGFVFCPKNLETPFRVGGDYDGCFPLNAVGALNHYDKYFNRTYKDDVKWFIKFVHKVRSGVDFSLTELEIEKRNLEVISGHWPW